jgi:hypothetical protein
MSDKFTRPYVQQIGDGEPRFVYLTDAEYGRLSPQGTVRHLRPGEAAGIGVSAEPLTPEVVGEMQIVPAPATRQAADTILGDTKRHPVPEVRERSVP